MTTTSTTPSLKEQSNIIQTHKEIITPYQISIALLTRCYIEFRESDEYKDNPNEILKVKYRRNFALLLFRLMPEPEGNLEDIKLVSEAYQLPLELIVKFDAALEALNDKGIDNLFDFIDSLRKLLNNNDLNQSSFNKTFDAEALTVSKNSVFGYFISKLLISFELLNYSEVSNIYKAFLKYYGNYTKKTILVNENGSKQDEKWPIIGDQWSKRQASLFLSTQAALLHNEENKAIDPKTLQTKICSILKTNPDLAEAHFLSYLNYLRVGEFCGAMQSLFNCFDKRLNPEIKSFNHEKSKEHRYAALNLAILYYQFGHNDEALAALSEAIRIAQEANDSLCLQHALSWMARLSNVNKDNLLVECIIKTFELNSTYITSQALQNFAQSGCANASLQPAILFETLTKSDMLNCQHNYKDLIVDSHMMKAALWQVYGKSAMTSLWSQVVLYLNINTNIHVTPYYGEGYCIAICNTASILFSEGDYNGCSTVLEYAKKLFPNEPLSHIWMSCQNLVNFTRNLYHQKWDSAEVCAHKIGVYDQCEGYLRLAELYYHKQDFVEAEKFVKTILNLPNLNENGKFYTLRANILFAQIKFTSTSTNTLMLFNKCLVEAERYELSYQIALIQLHMAHALLNMGLCSQALKALNANRCMIEIMANGGHYDRARALLLYTKCVIADSRKLKLCERGVVILEAIETLESVKAYFEAVESYSRVLDVLYLQGILYNSLNMKAERNKTALEFRLLNEEYQAKNGTMISRYL